ncbi:MAG TPA: helix-turn-helix transcriptional regulator [Thermoanaerobaculia bacterium]|nr:helix-turn-helix transcriptional regulator [Thermoanaerobaculia bacterium]
MKLGDVIRKEREKRGLSPQETAERLGLAEEAYLELEAGSTPAESWGPTLAQIAIALETPTSRLIAESGRAADHQPGQAGKLIRGHRERRGQSPEDLAQQAGLSPEEYAAVESGESPIEQWGPLLLHFAEVIEQPVFNLFYPCGLPFQELDDYP